MTVAVAPIRSDGWYTGIRRLFRYSSTKQIGLAAVAVYQVLLSHVDTNTGLCWPGFRKIAETLGCHTGMVSEAIEELEAAGLIVIEKRSRRESWRYLLPDIASRVSEQPGHPEPRVSENPRRVSEQPGHNERHQENARRRYRGGSKGRDRTGQPPVDFSAILDRQAGRQAGGAP